MDFLDLKVIDFIGRTALYGIKIFLLFKNDKKKKKPQQRKKSAKKK